MSNFSIFLVGFLVLTAGLAWGAFQLGVPTIWIVIGAVILLGIGILSGVSRTRQREKPPAT
jgi:hypothetical protein